jgi:hypothetical protein
MQRSAGYIIGTGRGSTSSAAFISFSFLCQGRLTGKFYWLALSLSTWESEQLALLAVAS